MKATVVSSVLGCVLMIGCSSTKIFVEQDYQDKRIKDASIAVVVMDKDPEIRYSGNVEPEFGPGNKNNLILDYFSRRIPELLPQKATFKEVLDAKSIQPEPSSVTSKGKQGSPTYGYSIPAQGTQFLLSGNAPDFVLFIDNLYIGTEFSTSGTGMAFGPSGGMMMTGGSTKKELKAMSEVVIWDNLSRKAVLYGNVEAAASGFFPIITKRTWESMTSKYVEEVIKKSPFAKQD